MTKPLTGSYMAHSADTTEEQARAAFVARHGCEPEHVERNAGCVLVGPKPEEVEDVERGADC